MKKFILSFLSIFFLAGNNVAFAMQLEPYKHKALTGFLHTYYSEFLSQLQQEEEETFEEETVTPRTLDDLPEKIIVDVIIPFCSVKDFFALHKVGPRLNALIEKHFEVIDEKEYFNFSSFMRNIILPMKRRTVRSQEKLLDLCHRALSGKKLIYKRIGGTVFLGPNPDLLMREITETILFNVRRAEKTLGKAEMVVGGVKGFVGVCSSIMECLEGIATLIAVGHSYKGEFGEIIHTKFRQFYDLFCKVPLIVEHGEKYDFLKRWVIDPLKRATGPLGSLCRSCDLTTEKNKKIIRILLCCGSSAESFLKVIQLFLKYKIERDLPTVRAERIQEVGHIMEVYEEVKDLVGLEGLYDHEDECSDDEGLCPFDELRVSAVARAVADRQDEEEEEGEDF